MTLLHNGEKGYKLEGMQAAAVKRPRNSVTLRAENAQNADGRIIYSVTSLYRQNSPDNSGLNMGPVPTYDVTGNLNTRNTIGGYGCLFTSAVNIGNTVRGDI